MADGHCMLCDCVHPRYEHRCAVCCATVNEDVVRWTLTGNLVCGLCRTLVDGPDEEEAEA